MVLNTTKTILFNIDCGDNLLSNKRHELAVFPSPIIDRLILKSIGESLILGFQKPDSSQTLGPERRALLNFLKGPSTGRGIMAFLILFVRGSPVNAISHFGNSPLLLIVNESLLRNRFVLSWCNLLYAPKNKILRTLLTVTKKIGEFFVGNDIKHSRSTCQYANTSVNFFPLTNKIILDY